MGGNTVEDSILRAEAQGAVRHLRSLRFAGGSRLDVGWPCFPGPTAEVAGDREPRAGSSPELWSEAHDAVALGFRVNCRMSTAKQDSVILEQLRVQLGHRVLPHAVSTHTRVAH